MRKLKLFLSLLMLMCFSVGNVWGADVTSTYSSPSTVDNGTSKTISSVTWEFDDDAIGENSTGSMKKCCGTITLTLPSGATLKSVTASLNNASNWGKTVTLSFKSGSTTLASWAKNGSSNAVTISSNTQDGTYTFVGNGNAWINSLAVTYTPGSGSNNPTV